MILGQMQTLVKIVQFIHFDGRSYLPVKGKEELQKKTSNQINLGAVSSDVTQNVGTETWVTGQNTHTLWQEVA